MLRAGNPWGWLSIAGAGLSGFGAAAGGFGALRRFGNTGKDAVPPRAIAKAQTAARKTAGCNCFVSCTEVLTPTGEKAIEQIKVGQRVLTYAPGEYEGQRAPVTELDPATTKQITLTLGEAPSREGELPGAVTTVVLLRSDEWIESKHLEVGGTIPLDLAELGVKGQATVAAIEDCPELEEILPGPGAEEIDAEGTRLVTATFHHTLGYPLDLKLEGLDTPIGVTRHHLIYSEDRRDWVPVGDLETRERVRVAGDVFEVEYAHERPEPEAVYNLEVDGDHIYRVTDAGVVVHNQSCDINIAYRVIRPDERPELGLFPKNPSRNSGNLTRDITAHVQMGSKIKGGTRFISLTRSANVSLDYATRYAARRVVIDLRQIDDPIFDLSTEAGRLKYITKGARRGNNFAKASREVLVEGNVPAEAILDVLDAPSVSPHLFELFENL